MISYNVSFGVKSKSKSTCLLLSIILLFHTFTNQWSDKVVLNYCCCFFNYGNYFCQQLQQFSVVRDTTVIKSVLDQAMAQTRTNIQWLRDNYNIFRDWLANRDQPSPPTPAGKYRYGGNCRVTPIR